MFNIQQVPYVNSRSRSYARRPIKCQGTPNGRGVPTGLTILQQCWNRFDHLSLGCLLENKPVVNKYDTILSSQTSATDVLKAMGAMPSGFRSTTLGKMVKEGKLLGISAPISKYYSCYWITDILSEVCRSGSLVIYKINDRSVKQVFIGSRTVKEGIF